ncbi:hypothetical protein EKO27_g11765 [Xylaria grammica]|uniref:2EXR domain-containing protein n=1 Tax=Xylaria grammica TaxID=363999 RepID=A0A439CMG2_9PEZI|nr:hypothetical protein EKO27_g11765 [Xylaria grammica]
MANRPINREKQSTATPDATEPVVSEAVGGKGRKRVCPDDRSDEPRARDLLEQLIQRFDKHEVTVRAEMDSLKTDFIEKMVSTVSHSNIRREEWIHRLQRDVLDLKTELSAQGGNLHTLRASIDDGLATLRAGTTALQGDVSALRRNLGDINVFPQFRRLPPELRCMVWKRLAIVRILELRGLDRDGSLNRRQCGKFRFIGARSPPVIAHVCRESRNIACRHGRLIWIENSLGVVDRLQPSKYIREWTWFDYWSDTLYFNAIVGKPSQVRNAIILSQVRHLILKPAKLEKLWFLHTMFPCLTSVQLIVGSLEWPVRQDLEFEASLWRDGNTHVIVRVEDGADGAERAHADLRNRLSPHCGAEACASLCKLVTASRRCGTSFDNWVGSEKPGRRLEILRQVGDRSMLSRVWILSLVPEDGEDRVEVFPRWLD